MATEVSKYGTYEESNLGMNLNITANQIRANAPLLDKKWCIVTSVLHNGDYVRLPVSKIGMQVSVKHLDAAHPVNKINVVPQPGESIAGGINADAAIPVYQANLIFVCIDGGDWRVI